MNNEKIEIKQLLKMMSKDAVNICKENPYVLDFYYLFTSFLYLYENEGLDKEKYEAYHKVVKLICTYFDIEENCKLKKER